MWGAAIDEVTFQDLTSNNALAQQKKGYQKIEGCCAQALKDGFSHVWIDTCCIDKTSSADLSEALNSMYYWYGSSKVCYAYLADVLIDGDPRLQDSSFRQSRWFSRGWTLQELIAPLTVNFFASDWTQIGDKLSLADLIEEITKINKEVLFDRNNLSKASVAQRMSWASLRQTTRIEDEAYALMGIFGVNMPTIYGEGPRAFVRLQQEIMRISNDHSIFAWQGSGDFYGMLATSPRQFADSSGYTPMEYEDFVNHFRLYEKSVYNYPATGYVTVPRMEEKSDYERKPDYTLTNFGLHIQLPLVKMEQFDSFYFAFLACTYGNEKELTIIFLRRRPGRPKGHFYRMSFDNRTVYHNPALSDWNIARAEILWVSGNEPRLDFNSMVQTQPTSVTYEFIIQAHQRSGAIKLIDSYPAELVACGDEVRMTVGTGPHAAVIFQHKPSRDRILLVFGVRNRHMWVKFHITDIETAKKSHLAYDMFAYEDFYRHVDFVEDLSPSKRAVQDVGNFAIALSQSVEGGDGGGTIERCTFGVRHI
jgi:hypothetical protein